MDDPPPKRGRKKKGEDSKRTIVIRELFPPHIRHQYSRMTRAHSLDTMVALRREISDETPPETPSKRGIKTARKESPSDEWQGPAKALALADEDNDAYEDSLEEVVPVVAPATAVQQDKGRQVSEIEKFKNREGTQAIGAITSPPPHPLPSSSSPSRSKQLSYAQAAASPPHPQTPPHPQSPPSPLSNRESLGREESGTSPPGPQTGPVTQREANSASPNKTLVTGTETGPSSANRACPPIMVERLPNWVDHFEALRKELGHAPNARPYGTGIRFLAASDHEFRIVQRYLKGLEAVEPDLSWYMYAVKAEIPTKVAIEGIPADTDPEKIAGALRKMDFPARYARLIAPRRKTNRCIFYAQLDRMNEKELARLYSVREILNMPGVEIRAWNSPNGLAQCHRCQLIGHHSGNCHRPIRCLRCAGGHALGDCTSPKGGPFKCANCLGPHTANDGRCPYLKRSARVRGKHLHPPMPTQIPSGAPRGYNKAPPKTTAQNAPMEHPRMVEEPAPLEGASLMAAANPERERGSQPQPIKKRPSQKKRRRMAKQNQAVNPNSITPDNQAKMSGASEKGNETSTTRLLVHKPALAERTGEQSHEGTTNRYSRQQREPEAQCTASTRADRYPQEQSEAPEQPLRDLGVNTPAKELVAIITAISEAIARYPDLVNQIRESLAPILGVHYGSTT